MKKLMHTLGYTLLLIGFVFILGIISYQAIGIGIGYSDDIFITFKNYSHTIILKEIPYLIDTSNLEHNRYDTYYSLSCNEQVVYDYLYAQSKNILTGDDYSLTFNIGIKDLDIDFSNQTIKEVEKNVSAALNKVDFNKVFFSLRQDYPYYCWYLHSFSYHYDAPRIIVDNNGFSKSYFVLKINSAYSDISGKYLDSSELLKARAAYNNAKAIVDSTKEFSTYDKIKYYTDYILNNTAYYTDYNNDTSSKETWCNFISVFDNNDNTLSVCGGYADAFKLLCDLGDIECYQEIGLMNNEYHAWNEVYIDDIAYMIDTTNIDDGSIGQGYKLYLKEVSGNEYTFYIYGEAVNYQKLSLEEMIAAS